MPPCCLMANAQGSSTPVPQAALVLSFHSSSVNAFGPGQWRGTTEKKPLKEALRAGSPLVWRKPCHQLSSEDS